MMVRMFELINQGEGKHWILDVYPNNLVASD